MEIQQQGQQGKTQVEISTEPGGKASGQVHISLPLLGDLVLTPGGGGGGSKAEIEMEAG